MDHVNLCIFRAQGKVLLLYNYLLVLIQIYLEKRCFLAKIYGWLIAQKYKRNYWVKK